MNNLALGICLALGANFIAAVSQLLLKRSSAKDYDSWLRSYLNLPVLSAYGLLLLTLLINMLAMKNIDMVLAAVLATSGQVFVPVLSRIFLKEKISRRRVLGMALIVVGIFVFSLKF